MTQKHLISTKQNNYSNFIIAFLLFTITLLLINSCNTTEPPPKIEGTISLTVEDASSTEAWLNVKLQNVNLPAELKLFREDSVTRIFNPSISDTLLYEEGLLPNKTYTYKVTIQAPNTTAIQSKAVTLTTMDTTSHNFSWQTYTFGGANGSSVLNDVAIINENNIWAVGEIHTAETDQFDSNGVWVQPYNAVHWDGSNWELKRIMWDNSVSRLTCVLAFASDDVWFGVTNLIHWNGNNFEKNWNPTLNEFTDKTVNAMWGTSSSDFYVVGNNGNIAHYNGSGWTKIESGTGAAIQDIWGVKVDSDVLVACAVSNIASQGDRKILFYKNGVKQNIFWPSGLRINSIWFLNIRQMFSCGDGIYKRDLGGNWDRQIGLQNNTYTERIRGENKNDIFVVGDFGFVAHYNGLNWKIYEGIDASLYYSMSYKGNVVVAVGERNAKGVIIVGKK